MDLPCPDLVCSFDTLISNLIHCCLLNVGCEGSLRYLVCRQHTSTDIAPSHW